MEQNRALGGVADVAAWGAVLSILMKLFPARVAQIMSWTEMFFGLGYMMGKENWSTFGLLLATKSIKTWILPAGPALGAFLFEVGGYLLPFVLVGSIGLVVATGMVFLIPNVKSEPIASASGRKLTFSLIIRVWAWFLDVYVLLTNEYWLPIF